MTLHELLKGVLTPVAEKHRDSEIEMASMLLYDMTEVICHEILLVDLDELGRGQRRADRSRRRPRR